MHRFERAQHLPHMVDGFSLCCESALVAKLHRNTRRDYISKSNADVVRRVH
jgi:hypothetical protein